MNFIQVPLQQIPAQTVALSLNGQNCAITLREFNGRQYFSLTLNGVTICSNVLLQTNSSIINAAYTGFIGDFVVIDMNGTDAPIYTGWNTRWVLSYYYG